MEREIAFEEEVEGSRTLHLFNDYEVYSRKINKFKGFNCFNNNFEINCDGKVRTFCKNFEEDLTKNPDFFKNLKNIESMVCPFDFCNCDGLLKIYKSLNKK